VVSRRGLFQDFQQTVASGRLWRAGEKLLVGVSGGPDSVALLHLLCATGQSPVVAHVNHRLRGADSDRDERFVHELCARWGLEFEGARVHTPPHARAARESIEDAARKQRYDFFRQVALERGIRKVLVAHNRNDQAETLLMRLLRGAGRRGLGGMKIQGTLPIPGSKILLIRPLLRVRRDALLAYLKQNHVPFRTDRTNEESRFFRNRIRRRLIPLLEREFQPSVVEVLARTSEILAEEDRMLENRIPNLGRGGRVSGAKLLRLADGLRGRALSRWLEACGCPAPSWERIEALLRMLSATHSGDRRVQLSSGCSVRVNKGSLSFETGRHD
jgi:tRNA(Ile)-lysidine synthase